MSYYAILALGLLKSKQIEIHKHRCGIEASILDGAANEKFWVPGYSERFNNIEDLRSKLHKDVDATVDQFIKDIVNE